MKQLSKNFDVLKDAIENYSSSALDMTISPTDTMGGKEHYFFIGASAAEVILSAISASQLTRVEQVLDLPCGHGRVLRHLVRMFPSAKFDACDLDTAGVKFCASQFGAKPVHSKAELTELRLRESYDLIWIGSLFTHTPLHLTKRWLGFLANHLSATGILVATFHGRWTTRLHQAAPHIDENSWNLILKECDETGYGYQNYPAGLAHGFTDGNYGVSLAKPSKILEIAENIPDTRIFTYTERAWGHHQDVLVLGKPKWNEGEA